MYNSFCIDLYEITRHFVEVPVDYGEGFLIKIVSKEVWSKGKTDTKLITRPIGKNESIVFLKKIKKIRI